MAGATSNDQEGGDKGDSASGSDRVHSLAGTDGFGRGVAGDCRRVGLPAKRSHRQDSLTQGRGCCIGIDTGEDADKKPS